MTGFEPAASRATTWQTAVSGRFIAGRAIGPAVSALARSRKTRRTLRGHVQPSGGLPTLIGTTACHGGASMLSFPFVSLSLLLSGPVDGSALAAVRKIDAQTPSEVQMALALAAGHP